MGDENAPVYVMSVAAELTGLHPQTLRIYERRGLVQPARTAGGNRRYSDADLARLRRISELSDVGINLEGARRVLQLEHRIAQLVEALERHHAEPSDRPISDDPPANARAAQGASP